MATSNDGYIAALDVGERRIGVALAHNVAALPAPLTTLQNTETIWDELNKLFADEHVAEVVVGLPRGLDGQETDQTAYTRRFVQELQSSVDLPIHFQDEAGTSVAAKEELTAKGKGYNKGMVDALAATIILQDYLSNRKRKG